MMDGGVIGKVQLDEPKVARQLMAEMVVEVTVNGDRLQNELFGYRGWRLVAFRGLLWLACRLLRCQWQMTLPGGEESERGR